MTPKATNSLMQRLKEETEAHHSAVEKCVDIMRPDLTLQGYRCLLERFHGFYQPYEAALDRLAGMETICPEYARRKKTISLQADLRALGLSPATIGSLPACQALPPLASSADALGALYVTEGATLGGAIIARHVIVALGLTPASGCAFFVSYGEERGPMWRRLGEAINSTAPGEVADGIVRSAKRTFESFEQWLKNER